MSSRARDLIAEGILIVVSILVAFAIDAWWADRQDRAEERRILESLKAEFQANVERIPRFVENHRKSAGHATALGRALHEAGPGGTVEFPYPRLASAMVHSSTDPQRGALDAILQSGELRFIRNPRIRERLARWPQLVVDATENEELLRKHWDVLLRRVVSAHVDLSPISLMDDTCWDDESLDTCQMRDASVPYDTEIIGMLQPVAGYANEAARELSVLIEDAQEIITLIDRELATHQAQ